MALTLIYRIFATFVSWMVLRARPDRAKEIEILVLRHQLAVLQRGTPRPRMRWIDRAVIAALTPAHLGEHAPPGRLARPRAAEAVLARACLILTDWETAYRTGQLPARTAHPHTDPATTLDTLLAAVPPPVIRLLSITGLTGYLSLFHRLDDALSAAPDTRGDPTDADPT